MRIDNTKMPKSSFLSLEKDLKIIIDYIFQNERLKKLLYYTTNDCLDRPRLSEDETLELIKENIRIVPKLPADDSLKNYVIITFDNFYTNFSNPQFRDNVIEFDIICNYDNWHLKDYQLRPYRIAAELDSILDGARLSGIGKLEFGGAKFIPFNENFGGLCLLYEAVHGEEDKKGFVNPADEEQFLKDLNF